MSFFDEDDDPPRTTSRTRVRSAPPPRRGRVTTAGGPSDPQTVLVRRMVAGIVGVVILLLLFFVVRACNNTRQRRTRCATTTARSPGSATASQQTGDQFFKQMDAAAQTSPAELYQSILGYKGEADNTLKQAQELSVPGDMAAAQQSLLILLELRRDGLASIAEQIRTALGDEGEAADQAIEAIAGDMRAFDASDVLYDPRVIPFIKSASRDAGDRRADDRDVAVPEGDLLGLAAYVASRLDQQLSTDAGGDGDGGERDPNEPTGPGLHGTGLDATSYGNVTLQPGTSNRLTYVEGQPFTVAFTNQGENDEFNVKVTLRIRPQSGNADHAQQDRPDRSPRVRRPPSSSRSTASRRSARR